MRKRIIAAALMAVLACIALVGCGEKKKAEPLDLTGNWEEKDTSDGYRAGYIKDDKIYLFWVSDGGDTKMLYWAGTYAAPTDDTVPYTWESVADKEQTGSALLASTDDSKTFTYEDGELTYSASAFGATKKMRLVKTDKDYSY